MLLITLTSIYLISFIINNNDVIKNFFNYDNKSIKIKNKLKFFATS